MADLRKEDHTLRLAVVGSRDVGKTFMIKRLCGIAADDAPGPSWAMDCAFVKREVAPHGVVALQIWDIAGMDASPEALPKQLWRDLNAVIIVYDITVRASFANVQGWVNAARDNISDVSPIFVLGNKLDLAAGGRAVTTAEGKACAASNNTAFAEVSALCDPAALMGVADEIVRSSLSTVAGKPSTVKTQERAVVQFDTHPVGSVAQPGWRPACCAQ